MFCVLDVPSATAELSEEMVQNGITPLHPEWILMSFIVQQIFAVPFRYVVLSSQNWKNHDSVCTEDCKTQGKCYNNGEILASVSYGETFPPKEVNIYLQILLQVTY